MCNWHGQRRHARGPRWPTKRQGHASTKSSARHDTPLISIKPPLALKKRGSETFFSSGLFFIQCQSKISNVVQLKIQAVWFSSFLVQIIHGLFKCWKMKHQDCSVSFLRFFPYSLFGRIKADIFIWKKFLFLLGSLKMFLNQLFLTHH